MSKVVIDRAVVEQAMKAMLNFPGDILDEMFESIRALKAALAQEQAELPLEDALSKAYYYTEKGEWRGSEVRDWDRWHAVAKVAVALIQRPALAESREHITDGTPCWCGPEAVYTDPDTGASVILHKRPQ